MPTPLPLPRLLAGLAAALLLAGCVVTAPQAPQAPRIATMSDLALVSSLGEEPGVKITAVNGVAIAPGARVGKRPADEPAGMNSTLGVWLAPGPHVVHVQYVRNIDAGISFTRGDVPIRVAAGHTYLLRPVVASDFGKVTFSLIDHGTAFPLPCLPAALGTARRPAGAKPAKVTRADVLACTQQARR